MSLKKRETGNFCTGMRPVQDNTFLSESGQAPGEKPYRSPSLGDTTTEWPCSEEQHRTGKMGARTPSRAGQWGVGV